MYTSSVYKWDELVEYWDVFEERGLNVDLVMKAPLEMQKPLCIVGSGRGLILKHLQEKLGSEDVWGFDISDHMIKAAHKVGCANVRKVEPFSPVPEDLSFNTIIIATGVLDALKFQEITQLLSYLRKRLLSDGSILISVFARKGTSYELAQSIGAISELGIENSRLLQLCKEYHSQGSWKPVLDGIVNDQKKILQVSFGLKKMDKLVRLVSERRSCEYNEAAVWLHDVMAKHVRLFTIEEIIECVGAAELKAVQTALEKGVQLVVAKRGNGNSKVRKEGKNERAAV